MRNEETTIIFFAFRYALGRETYASTLVIEHVKSKVQDFADLDLIKMAEEINEANDLDMLGSPDIDKPIWLDFKEYLKAKLKERNIYVGNL